jgi:hypothetical protein
VPLELGEDRSHQLFVIRALAPLVSCVKSNQRSAHKRTAASSCTGSPCQEHPSPLRRCERINCGNGRYLDHRSTTVGVAGQEAINAGSLSKQPAPMVWWRERARRRRRRGASSAGQTEPGHGAGTKYSPPPTNDRDRVRARLGGVKRRARACSALLRPSNRSWDPPPSALPAATAKRAPRSDTIRRCKAHTRRRVASDRAGRHCTPKQDYRSSFL